MEFWAFVSTLYNKINENWRWRGFFSSSGGFIGMSFYEISEQGIEVAQMAIAGSNKIVLCEQVLLQSAARTVTAVQPPSSQYLQAALRNFGSTPPHNEMNSSSHPCLYCDCSDCTSVRWSSQLLACNTAVLCYWVWMSRVGNRCCCSAVLGHNCSPWGLCGYQVSFHRSSVSCVFQYLDRICCDLHPATGRRAATMLSAVRVPQLAFHFCHLLSHHFHAVYAYLFKLLLLPVPTSSSGSVQAFFLFNSCSCMKAFL